MLTDCYIGLGSNLGDPARYLHEALDGLDALPETRVIAVSPLFRTAPVGPADQPDFLNAVARLQTALDPHGLLAELQALEHRAGRVRGRHWGERTLDLDLLLYGTLRLDGPDLVVPHPRLAERGFVLVPLHALNPDLALPDGRTVESLYQKCNKSAVWYHGEADWRVSP